jgi:hypothetical protein
MTDYAANGGKPALLHDCHNGCASVFGGPTLAVSPCNRSDTSQHWTVALDGTSSALVDGTNGWRHVFLSILLDGHPKFLELWLCPYTTQTHLGTLSCLDTR